MWRKRGRFLSLSVSLLVAISLLTSSILMPKAVSAEEINANGTIEIEGTDDIAESVGDESIFAGGSGTEEDPYIIETAEQLKLFARSVRNSSTTYLNEYVSLKKDIDLSSVCGKNIGSWSPIGGDRYGSYPFSGVFDGEGHSITNLYIDDTIADHNYKGFFSYIGKSGIVKNLSVEGDIVGGGVGRYGYCYGIIASSNAGCIINCHSKGCISYLLTCGGIAGWNSGTISHCVNEAILKNCAGAGGIAGENCGKIEYCRNVANFDDGSCTGCGGIASSNSDGIIVACYNTGNITGMSIGGIVRANRRDNINSDSKVLNCYNTGRITAFCDEESYDWRFYNVGGIVGKNDNIVQYCYNVGSMVKGDIVGNHIVHIGDIYGTNGYYAASNYYLENDADFLSENASNLEGNEDAISLSQSQMKNSGSYSGWDFESTWKISSKLGRPVLRDLSEEDTSTSVPNIDGSSNNDSNESDYLYYEGHTYKVFNNEMSWEDASAYCKSLGGYLVSFYNVDRKVAQEENDKIYAYLTDQGYDSAWIGYYKSDTRDPYTLNEYIWQWDSNEGVLAYDKYENWHHSTEYGDEPNGDGDYALFFETFSDGTWNDDGREKCRFICEWSYSIDKDFLIDILPALNNTSYEYNHDIALLAAQLSGASESKTSDSIAKMYNEQGFGDIYFEGYGGSYAFTIANKQVDDMATIVITARGSIRLRELVEDKNTGLVSDTVFSGYSEYVYDNAHYFEERIWRGLDTYLAKYPELKRAKNVKFLVTGHSLGGAAANLVAARMDIMIDNGNFLIDGVKKTDIFAYTYGAIDAITERNVHNGFENIHNIYNNYDTFGPQGQGANVGIVPTHFKPAGASSYGRFGNNERFSHYFKSPDGRTDSESTYNHNMGQYITAIINHYDYINTVSYAEVGILCPVDIEIKSGDKVVGAIKDNEIDTETTVVPMSIYNDHKYAILPVDSTYTINIVGTDAGTMDYFVEELSMREDDIKVYKNIALEKGRHITSEIRKDAVVSGSQVYIADDHGNILAEVQPDGAEMPMTSTNPTGKEDGNSSNYSKPLNVFVKGQKVVDFKTTFFSNAPDKTFFLSSDKKIASISKKGVLKAKKAGTVLIKAQASKDKNATTISSCSITILDKPKLMFPKYSVGQDIGKHLDGYGFFATQSTRQTRADKWGSSKNNVATVDEATGEIVIIGKGATKITAWFGNLKIRATLRVK